MPIIGAFMVPHPPLAVYEVGGFRTKDIKTTIDNYNKIVKEISELKPDTIVISSPHAPLYRDAFYILNDSSVKGDLSRFGASNISFNEKVDIEFKDNLIELAESKNIPIAKESVPLDHGTMVPLYFIEKYIKDFNIVLIGLSDISQESNYEMGTLVKEVTDKLNRRVVYIASGDLSHKLQEYGPYGFDEMGPVYDEKIMDVMKNARFNELLTFDRELLDRASECGHRSFIMMSGSLKDTKVTPKYYSHEDITGVGYGICSYYPVDKYIELARLTIDEYIRNNKIYDIKNVKDEELLNKKEAVFVSIHKNGDLRGCIGTVIPTKRSVAEEIISNAISASTRDPRFPRVRIDELSSLEINVDELSESVIVKSLAELDPKKYGVIVTSGYKRGLLLPDLEGVDTVEEQLSIAKRKGDITDNDDITIEKFTVIRHK